MRSYFLLTVLLTLGKKASSINLDGSSGSTSTSSVQCDYPYIVVDGLCRECSAGTYIGTSDCIECPIGSYTESASEESCTQCVGGKSTLSIGSASASDCVDVCTVPSVGYSSRTNPQTGTNVLAGSSVTTYCPSGYFINGQSTHTETCAGSLTSCRAVTVSTGQNGYYAAGSNVQLTCTVVSADAPTLNAADVCIWTKDGGAPLNIASQFSAHATEDDTYECVVSLTGVTASEAGDYSCSAVIGSHTEDSTSAVTLNVLTLTYDTTQIVEKIGTSIQITCTADMPTTLNAILTFEWERDGDKISSGVVSATYGVTRDSVLTLSPLTSTDSAKYKCIATYSNIGSISSSEKQVVVLRINAPVGNAQVVAGTSHVFTCDTYGTDQTVSWVMPSGGSDPGTVTSTSTTDGVKHVVNELTATTAGAYTCQVTNTDVTGSVTSTGNLEVNGVGWQSTQADIADVVGETVTFTLDADTYDEPDSKFTSIQWYRNGNAIHAGVVNTDETPSADQTRTVLTVTSATLSDAGYYSCVINYAGVGDITSAATKFYVNALVTGPTNTAGDRGQSATFTAVFSGRSISVVWEKASLTSGAEFSALFNGRASTDKSVDSDSLQTTFTLTITGLEASDEGAYIAKATYADDSLTIPSPAAALSVFFAEITQEYSFVGGSVTLTAQITANEEANNVIWFKYGSRMTESSTETYVVETGVTTSTIIIPTLTAADFTSYTVSADFETFTTTVQSDDMTLGQLTVTENPTGSDSIKVGDNFILTCKFDYPSGFTATPTIAWVRTSDIHTYTGTVTNTHDDPGYSSRMTIFPAADEDDGSWECTVVFDGITGTLKSAPATVEVSGITESPTSQNAVAGSLVTLSCVASTISEPTVAWTKDTSTAVTDGSGNTLTSTYTSKTFTSTLTIQFTATSDETYTCVITDTYLTSTYTSSVATVSPLKLTGNPAAMTTVSGASGKVINCVATAHSSLAISWYKGSTMLEADAKHSFATETTGSETRGDLTLNNIDIDTAGDYYCKATYNPSGIFSGGSITSSSATVSVISIVDERILMDDFIYKRSETNVVLTCVAVGPAEADSVTWTYSGGDLSIIGSPTSGKSYDPVKKETTASLTFTSLSDQVGGRFTCAFAYGADEVTSERTLFAYSVDLFVTQPSSVASNGGSVTFSVQLSESNGATAKGWYGRKEDTSATKLSNGGAYTVTEVSATEWQLVVDTSVANIHTIYGFRLDLGMPWVYTDTVYLYMRSFTMTPSADSVQEVGTAQTMSCVYQGDPTNSIKWFKEDTEVQQVSGILSYSTTTWKNSQQTSTLVFNSPSSSDSGEYKCQAEVTDGGSSIDSASVYIGFPRIEPPSNVHTVTGTTISLQCTIEIGTTGLEFLDDESFIAKSDGSSKVTLSLGEHGATPVVRGGDVSLPDVNAFTAYKCMASFNGGALTVESAYFDINQLQITTSPSTATTVAGNPVTFTCSASSPTSYAPTISFKNGVDDVTYTSIGDIAVSAMTTSNFIATKTLVNSDPQSEAATVLCEVEYNLDLIWLGGPKTEVSNPASYNILQSTGSATESPSGFDGVSLTISCAFSHTPSSITWYKDGALVDTTTNSGYEKSSSAPDHYLKIVSPKTTDAGVYTCEADYGTAKVFGTENTVSIKGFSAVPEYTKIKTGETFEISCTLSAGFGTSGYLEMIQAHPSFIDGWATVTTGESIKVDLESKELQIMTDSALNSNEVLYVDFSHAIGADDDAFGSGFIVRFGSTLTYQIIGCTNSAAFDSTPTSDENKIWRITEKNDHTMLYVHCNDELVLSYTYADGFSSCDSYYSFDMVRLTFESSDTASDSYRIVDPPQTVQSAVLTNSEQTLTYTKVATNAHLGSYYCTANSGQAVSQAADLVVVGIMEDPVNYLGYVGGTATFSCSARSDSEASGFKWYEQGSEITIDNSKYSETREFDVCSCDTFLSTSILTITNLEIEYALTDDNFKCAAIYGGLRPESATAVINLRFDEFPAIYAVKDAESKLACKWTDLTYTIASDVSFAIKYKTTSDGAWETAVGALDLAKLEYVYTISSTTTAMGSYFWKCETTIAGDSTPYETSEIQIVVVEETVSPELTQAWSGETEVKFTCEFTATLAESPSSVKWFKNSNQQMENEAGKIVIYAPEYNTGTGASKSVLEIKSPGADDEGYYNCAATYGTSPSPTRTYSSSAGVLQKWDPCPAGQALNQATGCENCPTDQWSADNNELSTCNNCPAGTGVAAGSGTSEDSCTRSVTVTGPTLVSDAVSATLTCTITGISSPDTVTAAWSGGGISGSITESTATYILESDPYNDVDMSRTYRLKITADAVGSLQPTSEFTCYYSEDGANGLSSTHSMRLISPQISTNPSSASYTTGDSFTLTCKGTGVDPADMTVTSFWTKDSGNVSPTLITDTSVSVSEVKSTLAVAHMESSLSGEYKCGLNYGGDIIYSQPTSINVAGVLYFPTHALVVSGQALTISIRTVTETVYKSVAWYKDDTLLAADDPSYTITTTVEDESSLKITTSKLIWTGVAASNQDSELHVEVSSDSFFVQSSNSRVNVLDVYAHPQTSSILREKDVYIYCSFEGPPQPSISWLSHESLTSEGSETQLSQFTKITVLEPADSLIVYQSRLTVVMDATKPPSYWSCRATYPSYNGDYIFSGGDLTTDVACITPIGITAVTGPSALTVGSTALFTATADNPPEPKFYWKFNGYAVDLDSADGEQLSSTEYKYVYEKTNMQVTDSGTYGVLATYDGIGSSGLVTVTTSVVDSCPRIAAPANGELTCDPTSYSTTSTTIPVNEIDVETSVSCTVTCNSGYTMQSDQSVYTCTDGIWEQNSVENPFNKVTRCFKVVPPNSLSTTISVAYELPWVASCTDYYGDYLRLSFPYLVTKAAPSLSCVRNSDSDPELDCSLDESYFAYDNAFDACYTTGRLLWLKVKYIQTGNTETDKRDELFTEFTAWVEEQTFSPYELMQEASCLTDCECCVLDSCLKAPSTIMSRLKCSSYDSDRRKRRSTDDDVLAMAFDAFEGTGNVSQVIRSDAMGCGPGSVPLGKNCIECVEGTYQSGEQCVSCPIGTYQDNTGTHTCESCPAGTSTTSTGATDQSLCIEVCQMEDVGFGVSDPPSGWIVKLGDPVTVRCNQGFQFGGQSISVTSLETCNDMPSCSRVQISTSSLNVLESSTLDLNCKVTATSSPELCIFYRNSEQINATEPISLEGGMFECQTNVELVESSDEGTYSCSAEWEVDVEPSNEIDIRVMGLTFDSTETVYAEKSDHTFFCAATVPSDSAVFISWTRNGQPIGERLTATSNPAIGVLNLMDISPRDQGDYQCRATYLGVGTIVSEPARLTVVGFLETLTNMDLTKGSSATLHCRPTIGEISWTLNDSPLSTTSTSLEIKSVGQQDEGIYRCQANFQGEIVYSSAEITVSDTGITQHPVDITLRSGEQATLTCATNIDSSFKWYMNEDEVKSGVDSTAKQSVLVTSPLTMKTRVQCVVTTGEGKSYSSKIGMVNVVGFKTVPQSKGLPLNGDVSLLCSVIGDGLTQLAWVRADSKEIPSSNMISFNTGYSTSNVLTTGEKGVYFCRAVFEEGYTIESDWAAVTPVRVEMSSKSVAFGEDITLTCTVTGAIKADMVFWTLNGELILNDKSLKHVTGGDKSLSYLALESVTTSDTGEYRCAASMLSDLSVYGSEPAPLKLLGFVDTVSDVVVKRGYLTEVAFSVRHQEGVRVSCDLSHGEKVMAAADLDGDVAQFRGEVTSVGVEVKRIQYSCSVQYGSSAIIKSESASIYIVDDPKLVARSAYVLIGEVALFTLTTDYITNVPSVHWRVNSLTTVQFSDSYTNMEYSSTLQWPVTHDIQVEATVHYADVGGYSVSKAMVLAYGVKEITGPEIVHLGESYNLTCSVATIDEETEITWYRGNTPLLPHSTFYYDDKILSVLYLPDVSVRDIGVYECNAQFSDGEQSSAAFYLTQTNDCKLPEIENALMDTSLAIIPHLNELVVTCGDEEIVMKCEHGSWDRTLVFCPAAQSAALTMQLVTGLVVVIVVLVAAVGAVYYYKKHSRSRAVTPLPRPDSVFEMKRAWRDFADNSEVINNPLAPGAEENNRDVNIASQYHQQLERTVTQISS